MSLKFDECIHCQKPFDIERLERPGIAIVNYNQIHPPGDYHNLEIITIMQCQFCHKNNHILWQAKKMMNKEEVEKQANEIEIAEGKAKK
jgi:hypothetical protein